jgi:vesicle coat complex subunit
MLATDKDATVVANCLIVLREIDGEQTMATKQNVYGGAVHVCDVQVECS